ncbi:MAG TPA: T9SS type A sorting domain-containing protein [Saprospiraceae bacterium]|nr:T9SS type A sorting domain-containing protein [Saprospiraceae bacterium]
MNYLIKFKSSTGWIPLCPIYYQLGVLSCMFLSICAGICQSGYNQTFDDGISLSFRSVISANDHVFISGIYRPEAQSFQQGFIAAFDTLGGLTWWKEIEDDSSSITMNVESGMCTVYDAFVALKYGYFEKNSIGLALIDFSGNILCMNEYVQFGTLNTVPLDIIPVNDGFMITGTIQFTDFNVDAFILKTDKNGKFLWKRTNGHPIYWENSRTITMKDNNELVISGTRYQWEQEPIFYHGWAYAIDSLGNKKWEWEASEEEVPHRGIMSMQYDSVNHEWVYVSFIEKPVFVPDLGRDVNLSVPVLVRRDSAMHLLSYTEYGPYSYNGYMGDLEQSIDGGYIASGRFTCLTEESPYNDCNVESGRVIKISANDTLEWSVIDIAFYHPVIGSQSYLSGVTESPSGSVYAVGWANNYDENEVYRSFGWLLKITKDGCVDTLCTTTSLLEQIEKREKKIQVYPNPASDYLIFEIAKGLDVVQAEIYDLSGRRMQYQQMRPGTSSMILDDGLYSSGMYVWRVVDAQGVQVGIGKVFVE